MTPEQWVAQMRREQRSLSRRISRALGQEREALLAAARRFAPVKTGRLRAALQVRAGARGLTLSSSGVSYARLIEDGGRTPWGAEYRAQEYLTRALREREPAITARLRRELTEVLGG